MNKITYLCVLMATMLASCNNKELVVFDDDEAPLEPGIYATVDDLQPGDESTRSSLVYNGSNAMTFQWAPGDNVGIYPYSADHPEQAQQQSFERVGESVGTYAQFISADGAIKTFKGADVQTYVACKPFNQGHATDYTNIPISFTRQVQTANACLAFTGDAYSASEANACAHLGAYDYLYSPAMTAEDDGSLTFQFHHVAATVRFYIIVPVKNDEHIVIESLQLVNNDTPFITEATLNAQTGALTTVTTSPVVELTLTGSTGTEFKFPNANYNHSSYGQMLAAYMNIAPVNQTSVNPTGKNTLFMVAHDADAPETKKYYMANISKKSLLAGKFYQWSVKEGDDKPIVFDNITVEKWQEGTARENNVGGEGAGTGNW